MNTDLGQNAKQDVALYNIKILYEIVMVHAILGHKNVSSQLMSSVLQTIMTYQLRNNEWNK